MQTDNLCKLYNLCNSLDLIYISNFFGSIGSLKGAFLDGYFSMKKAVLRSQISWLFLIRYELCFGLR